MGEFWPQKHAVNLVISRGTGLTHRQFSLEPLANVDIHWLEFFTLQTKASKLVPFQFWPTCPLYWALPSHWSHCAAMSWYPLTASCGWTRRGKQPDDPLTPTAPLWMHLQKWKQPLAPFRCVVTGYDSSESPLMFPLMYSGPPGWNGNSIRESSVPRLGRRGHGGGKEGRVGQMPHKRSCRTQRS